MNISQHKSQGSVAFGNVILRSVNAVKYLEKHIDREIEGTF